MRATVRFVAFITAGLFAYIFWMTGFIVLFLEAILPHFKLTDNQTAAAVWTAMVCSAISGGVLFSYWFVKPIAAMMRLIGDISAGNYNRQDAFQKIYKKSGKLKLTYWLYKELVSDVHLLAAQLKQAESEREKLEQAKQDWVRGISHDIKTPLSYVVGYSSLLTSSHDWSEEERQNFLSQIYHKGKYIEKLINNLNLSFRLEDNSKPLPLQISAFDLISFIKNLAADLLNQQPGADYPISVQTLDVHLNIEADEQLLYRAFANLIGNAVIYNPTGTEIKISIKRDEQTGVNITVCDNGVGMSQETIDNLFTKYGDTNGKKDYAGGLGLSIVKSIVEAHQGKIFAESKESEGMSFIIHLPLQYGGSFGEQA